jgi:hypothetical protein
MSRIAYSSNLIPGCFSTQALCAQMSQFHRQICHVDISDRVCGFLEELSILGDNLLVSGWMQSAICLRGANRPAIFGMLAQRGRGTLQEERGREVVKVLGKGPSPPPPFLS